MPEQKTLVGQIQIKVSWLLSSKLTVKIKQKISLAGIKEINKGHANTKTIIINVFEMHGL